MYAKSNVYCFQKISEFNWNKTLRGVILGSFYIGYLIMQVSLNCLILGYTVDLFFFALLIIFLFIFT